MVTGSAHIAFVLAAIVERAQGLVQHNNVDQVRLFVIRAGVLDSFVRRSGSASIHGASSRIVSNFHFAAAAVVVVLSHGFQFPFAAVVHFVGYQMTEQKKYYCTVNYS